MTLRRQITSRLSALAVIFDALSVILPCFGGAWNLVDGQEFLGAIVLGVSVIMLVFFIKGSLFLAAVFRDEQGALVFNYLVLPAKGSVSSIISINEMIFRRYPRYLVTFLDEAGVTREMVVLPAFEYKDEDQFKSSMTPARIEVFGRDAL